MYVCTWRNYFLAEPNAQWWITTHAAPYGISVLGAPSVYTHIIHTYIFIVCAKVVVRGVVWVMWYRFVVYTRAEKRGRRMWRQLYVKGRRGHTRIFMYLYIYYIAILCDTSAFSCPIETMNDTTIRIHKYNNWYVCAYVWILFFIFLLSYMFHSLSLS